MASFTFSLTAEATGYVHDSLVCLANFGETVSLEARAEKLTITALNLSRTAYASFSLEADRFFQSYTFKPTTSTGRTDRLTCQLYNKALQSVFKGRSGERGREPIERCDVHLHNDANQAECRLVCQLSLSRGITKTYRLSYESTEVLHALFDDAAATQGWRISARVLREYIEFFGPKTEQLDIVAQEDKIAFTSFTEKVHDGKEVLKQPLETAVAIHTDDFEDFHVQQDMHTIISVKDFKAIVTHAESLRGSVSAQFSYPSRPLRFKYGDRGILCEFTLMTTGDYRAASTKQGPKFTSNRVFQPPSVAWPTLGTTASQAQAPLRNAESMPPPPRPATLGQAHDRPSLTSERGTSFQVVHHVESDQGSQSLFIQDDNDQTWDPPRFDQNEGEEILGWDTNNAYDATPHPTFRDSGGSTVHKSNDASASQDSEGLPPTQRLSQLHGLFD